MAPADFTPDLDGLRTRTLCTRLPRYLIDMLQHLAAAERASLELFLSRELQDLASARRETLARGPASIRRGVRLAAAKRDATGLLNRR